MIDLHMHSEYSIDARDTPEMMVEQASKMGVEAMAITEHENIDSLERARTAARQAGIEYINGVEIGGITLIDGQPVNMHILGYLFTDDAPHIRALSDHVHTRRTQIARALLHGLKLLQIPVDAARVERALPGRLSAYAIRRVLREDGHAADKPESSRLEARAMQAAIEDDPSFAGLDEPLTIPRIISTLKADGATTLLAHPFWLTFPHRGGYSEADIHTHIDTALELGVDGLEVYNTGNDAGYCDTVMAICRERDLPASGGSDSHGIRNVGTPPASYELLDSIRRHRRREPIW